MKILAACRHVCDFIAARAPREPLYDCGGRGGHQVAARVETNRSRRSGGKAGWRSNFPDRQQGSAGPLLGHPQRGGRRWACPTTPIRKAASRSARSSMPSITKSARTVLGTILGTILGPHYHGVRYRTTGDRQIVEVHLLFPHATAVGEAHRSGHCTKTTAPCGTREARGSDPASGIAWKTPNTYTRPSTTPGAGIASLDS
jgi:hypothetical protein